jgi:electron transport complex protein RnfG
MGNVSEPAYRKRVGYQAALLGGFATLSAAFLAIGDISTHDTIAQRLAEDVQASLSQVVPDTVHDNNLLEDTVTLEDKGRPVLFYRATKNGMYTAAAFSVTSNEGYAGKIVLIMGVDAKGELLGVRVLSHAETPGLGDKIEEKKDDWIYSFNGLSLDNLPEDQWAVKKDGGRFDQFSGATITPRAVVKAVKEGLEYFKTHREAILAPPPAIDDPVLEDESEPAAKQTAMNTGAPNGD